MMENRNGLYKNGNNKKILEYETMSPLVRRTDNSCLGPIVVRASEIEKELIKGVKKPFNEIIKTNIGDGHAMGQLPITFARQVYALVAYPKLLDDPNFPEDAKKRAIAILNCCRGKSIGSYTDIVGLEVIRKNAANFIAKRDNGIPSDWTNIILSTGATLGIKSVLNLFVCDINGKKPGVLIPIPQYPIYSSLLAEFDMEEVDYYLDESRNWELNIDELERALVDAKTKCNPRVLVVINPGNPTGQVLSRKNIEDVIKLAYKENLFILADEVYQENIYDENCKFYSFKRVMTEMGYPYCDLELASVMSASKGYLGECGIRGGCIELHNMCPKVKAVLMRFMSGMLCPNVLGQIAIDCMVNPPTEDEPSYDLFTKEKNAVLQSLKDRAKFIDKELNSIPGLSCNPVQGAMYAFPSIHLPLKAIEAARKAGQQPDTFYAAQLLEHTGICTVSGEGFRQKEGTYHFRTTILPPIEKMKVMVEKLAEFHKKFMEKYK